MTAISTTRLMTRLATDSVGTRDVERQAREQMAAKLSKEGKSNRLMYSKGGGFEVRQCLRNEGVVRAVMDVKVKECKKDMIKKEKEYKEVKKEVRSEARTEEEWKELARILQRSCRSYSIKRHRCCYQFYNWNGR